MKLRDIVLLAESLGMSPVDFVAALFSTDGLHLNSLEGRRVTRLNRAFLDMDDSDQMFVLRMIDLMENRELNERNMSGSVSSSSKKTGSRT